MVLLRSMEEIERAFASRSDLVAQPFLDPPPDVRALTAPFQAGLPLFFSFPATLYSAEVIVGPDGASSTPFGSLNTQVAGMGTQMTRFADPTLLAVGRAYARAAAAEGWKGPINLQLKRTREGDLVAFEMNGRFGGATAGRTLMGFDEVGEAVHRFLPGADFASISPPETDTVQRYARTFPIPYQGRIALAEHGHRAARAVQPRMRAVDCASSTTIRMLLLSAGSIAARGIIDAIGLRRHRCLLLGTSSVANSAGNFSCDRVFVSPPAMQSSHYVECIAELIRQEHPDIVIPTCDHDVVALATLAARTQAGRAALLTGTLAAARIMSDKMEAAHFANRHGLSFAQTVARADHACELARTVGFPLIGKPRVSHQKPGVVVLRSVDEIERAFALRPDLVAQPYLGAPQELDALVARFASGLPFFFSVHAQSVAMTVIIGPDGSVSPPGRTLGLAVSEQGTRLVRSDDREMRKLGQAFAHAAAKEGWRGPLNVQMMPGRDRRLTAYALDGCLGGATAARAALGVDDIADVVRRYVPAARFPSFDVLATDIVSIHPHSYPVLRDGVAALQDTGRWSKG